MNLISLKKNIQKLNELYDGIAESVYDDSNALDNIRIENKQIATMFSYLSKRCNYPVYTNTKVQYYKSGEEMYPDMLEDLKKAQKYIRHTNLVFQKNIVQHQAEFYIKILVKF